MPRCLPLLLLVLASSACASLRPAPENTVIAIEAVRETAHRAGDDLLSAGLGLDGLRAKAFVFAEPQAPTPAELRRRAIHANWNGIADFGPLGGFGRLYGGAPNVPGREYSAFARLPGANSPHRMLVQVPDAFDLDARCLLVAPSSGSRGVYGAIALAGAWGLPRGCAVAYTDKGTGSDWFDLDSQTGVALDGTRAARATAPLGFEPETVASASGVAVKHAHSGDNPEADWGHHVLQAAQFGLAMLDRAHPAHAPFTPANTRVIAVGLSNGGGAVLQAAGIDDARMLAGVVALEPNVHVAGAGRALYDYVTEAALYLPCALADARFDTAPFARAQGATPAAWIARCARLRDAGLLEGADTAAQAASALEFVRAQAWDERVIATAASSTAFDLWRAVAATYASSYLRRPAGAMPCGFRFSAVDAAGAAVAADEATRAGWWSDASGIPPGAGVQLLGGTQAGADPARPGIECLRALWTGDDAGARALHVAVAATQARIPRDGLPIVVVHGEDDGLLPVAFTSAPYVQALQSAGRSPVYWRVPFAQHFDALLALPGFGERHVPLLPYGYAALDAMWTQLTGGAQAAPHRFASQPRGSAALESAHLGLAGRR